MTRSIDWPRKSPLRIEPWDRLVSVAEMQALERRADQSGHSFAAMMELAGAAVARELLQRSVTSQPHVLVLVGPGNNGGDGLVCALRLHEEGAQVRLYLWQRRTDPEHDYQGHFARAAAAGIECATTASDADFATLKSWIDSADTIVDALLGTGGNRPISDALAELLDVVRAEVECRPLGVVAVDCPSGCNCDTGAVDPHTLPATLTVTFDHAKLGHFKFPAAALIGELVVADIGIDPGLSEPLTTFALSERVLAPLLPQRPPLSHKGTFGKVMVAAGSMEYPGAASLALGAASRAGAGLVTGGVADAIWPVAAAQRPEATWVPLPSHKGVLTGEAAMRLAPRLMGYDALVLGCGLTQNPLAVDFVRTLLRGGELPPTLIDADGLNCLAGLPDWPSLLPTHCVLTPHPAEFARLLGLDRAEVVERRWELARAAAAQWKAVVVAKGPYTVVAAPDGHMAVLPVATPALATAGTGDVLSGVIGGLLAQGLDPFAAACLGAWLHAQAGLLCEGEIGHAGCVAGDLLLRLPRVMESLRERHRRNPSGQYVL